MNTLLKAVILLIILVTLNFCGGGDKETPTANQVIPDTQTQTSDVSSEEAEEANEEEIVEEVKSPKIKNVAFPEAPTAGKDLLVEVQLEEQDEDTAIKYRWFVNSVEITDATENTLSSDYFVCNNWIQCWVTAQKGNKTSGLFKSKFIRVKGAAPVIKVTPIGELIIPGTIKYKIDAYNPSIGENIASEENAMKYELLSPKEVGIQLNQETGELSWELDEEKIKKLGAKIEIKFQVSSKQSQTVTSSIILNFKQETPPQKKTEDQEKKENRSEPS